MSEDIEGVEARLRGQLTPYRLGLARMVDNGRKLQHAEESSDRRVAVHVQALRVTGFPPEMLLVMLALAVDQLSALD